MYEIFENARDNQEIFEAYSNLQNYKVLNFDRQGGYCYILEANKNFKKKLQSRFLLGIFIKISVLKGLTRNLTAIIRSLKN